MTGERRLTLVISTLGPGGAERVLSTMANHWARAGVAITLITLARGGADFYPLDPSITRVSLGLMSVSRGLLSAVASNLQRAYALRRAIVASRPRAVVSFCDRTNLLVLFSMAGLATPVIVSERVDPREQPLGHGLERLRRALYRRAAAIVVQTDEVRSWCTNEIGSTRVHVVPNPVSADPRISLENTEREKSIISVGRLVPQKGHDLLLSAFAPLRSRCPEWKVCIVGEGPQRAQLLALADELGLADSVSLPSTLASVQPLLRRAGIFVLPSRYEGFPNALLEAMAQGAPVVAFDCRSGPKEIVSHQIDGLLVPPEDVGALSAAIELLISDAALRKRLGDAAFAVVDRFSVESVMRRWDAVVADSIQASRVRR